MRKLAFYFLSLMVFTIPWEASVLWAEGTTFSRITGYLALCAGLMAIALRGSMRRPTTLHFLLLGFILYSALSGLWSLDPVSTIDSTEVHFRLLGIVLLVWDLALELSEVRWLMNAYVLGGCVAIVGTIQGFLSGESVHYQRYAADGFDPNDLALGLVVSIPMAWYLASTTRRTSTAFFYYSYMGAVVFAVVLTSSRGGVIAAIVSLLILPLSWARQRSSRKLLVVGLLLVAVSLGLKYIPEESLTRISTTGQELREGSLDSRTFIWSAGLAKFAHHPILGIGGSAFRSAISNDIPGGMVAHNTFLSILVEYGILGALLFASVIIELLFLLGKMPPNRRIFWVVTFAALGIGMFALSWLEYKPPWLLVGLVLAHTYAPLDKGECQDLAVKSSSLLQRRICIA